MRILWLSWRDIKNPDSGGAEKVAIETASRFAKEGIQVTIFTSSYLHAQPTENIRGVKIIRRGNRITCRLFALIYYLKNRNFDIVIDEINTIPFFTPFYAGNKTVTLIHQLAREYWYTQTFWPLNILGFFLEPIYLKLYRRTSTIVISNSTKNDLEKLGFEKIKVIRVGLDFKPQLSALRHSDLILFIGRLTRPKGPQDAVAAFKLINNRLPKTRLLIVGKSTRLFTDKLKKLIQKLALTNKVKLAGFVSQRQKINFLSKAKIVLIPSVREGWCLVATEANALGCVPIGYDVPGLRDSIKNNQTGFLTAKNPAALAESALRVLEDDSLRSKLERGGYHFAQKFSWNNTYEDLTKALVGKQQEALD